MCRASFSGSRGWGRSGSAGFWSSRQRNSETARQDYRGCVDSVTTGRRSSSADEVVETLARTALLVRERGGEERWETGASKREDGGGRGRRIWGEGPSPISRGAREEPLIPLLAATPPPSRCRRNWGTINPPATGLLPFCAQILPKHLLLRTGGLLAVGCNMPLHHS